MKETNNTLSKKQIRPAQAFDKMRQPVFFKPVIQPKLTINQPNDIYEQEADAVAEKVMRMPAQNNEQLFFQTRPLTVTPVQRKCAHCEEEETLQLKETSTAARGVIAPSIVNNVINSPGQSLDKGTRSFMESKFGYDFRNVQIHNDSLANQSSAQINALAYTHSNHVVFDTGQYQPDTYSGKKLLAHELAHVIQQQSSTRMSGETGTVQMQPKPSRRPGKVVRVEHDSSPLSERQYQDWITSHPNAEFQSVLPDEEGKRTADEQFSPGQLVQKGFYYARRRGGDAYLNDVWLNDAGTGKRLIIYYKK